MCACTDFVSLSLQLPWPRTQSEKLLQDMFEGSAAQMLAIMEAMNDSNRRTLLSQPPALDHEVEVLDVFAEMFMAAQEILAGSSPHTLVYFANPVCSL